MRCVGCGEEVCCEERCMCDSKESLYAPKMLILMTSIVGLSKARASSHIKVNIVDVFPQC